MVPKCKLHKSRKASEILYQFEIPVLIDISYIHFLFDFPQPFAFFKSMTNKAVNFLDNFVGAAVKHKQEHKRNTVVRRQENKFY